MIESSNEIQALIIRYSPYLQEIRKRILFVLAFFLIGASIGFIYFEPIIKLVMRFYDLDGLNLVFTSPFQFINLATSSAVVVGVMTVFPLLLYQTLSFLKPALKEKEYKLIISSIPLSFLLFIIGFAFGSWIMKFVVVVFSKQSKELQIQNLWDIEHFLTNIFTTSLLLGLFFQFPIILTPLIRLKVVKFSVVEGFRLPVYIGLLVFTIMLPPTDLLSNALIFFPLAFLFEMTLLFNRAYSHA